MVSFQCNGCGDVLTKPKLDKHRAVCHTSFDCIDCSKRFESPADYKGHTSCISEAEKYQKALYNGGKQSGPEWNGREQRSRQHGGGRQWGNNRPQWQQRKVNQGTGANDTPLGTPVRMSPVNDTPVVEENTQSVPAPNTPKKRKAEPGDTESNDTSEPTKKKKRKNGDGVANVIALEVKSGKKRKSVSEAMMTESHPQGPNLQSVEEGDALGEGERREKKKKKEKKVREGEEEERKKEKRKKKVDSLLPGQEPSVTETPLPTDTEKIRSAKKKSKSKATAADEAPDVAGPKPPQPTASEVTGARDDRTDRKKSKKRQSGNQQGCNGDGERVAEGNEDGSKEKRKEKKKKRRSESQVAVE